MTIQETLKSDCNKFGINITDEHLEKFALYYTLLIEWNEKINLTAITDPLDVARKHFLDSLLLLKDLDFTKIKSVIDVGTGAGFPGIPLKIVVPSLQLTLLDSLQKRCTFLNEVARNLRLENIIVVHERAEVAAQKASLREKFDLATARAVANLRIISEYCLPFVKPEGYFLAPKGKDGETEAEDAATALKILGGEIIKINTYELPEQAGIRKNILIKKLSPTPLKYPRKAGLPEKKPL